jgi:hypothetical protein
MLPAMPTKRQQLRCCIADVMAAFPTLTREEAIRDVLLLGGL